MLDVTVAIPTRDRSAMLEVCLGSVMRQDYPPDRYEILVADDGSRDDTSQLVAALRGAPDAPVVRYLRLPHRGSNAARNAALRVSTTDLVCYVDDDADVPAHWLSAIVDGANRHPHAGCLGGPIRLRLEGVPPRRCGNEPFGEGEFDLGKVEHSVPYLQGSNMAVRRSVLDAVGVFHEQRLLGHDETELMERMRAAGFEVVYLPAPWLWHRRTADQLRLRTLAVRRLARGYGEAHTREFAGRQYVPRTQRADLREGLRHAVGARCSWGLLGAARAAGTLAGIAACRVQHHLRR